MMGRKSRRLTPLPIVSLEALAPAEHFYRQLDQALDLSFVRDLVQDCYAGIGRPSIDPLVLFRLQFVMFFEGIRSERLLIRAACDWLSIRWYLGYNLGYNLGDSLPDHSSLTRIRLRYGLELFRRFFEEVLEQCRQAKLLWGQRALH